MDIDEHERVAIFFYFLCNSRQLKCPYYISDVSSSFREVAGSGNDNWPIVQIKKALASSFSLGDQTDGFYPVVDLLT